ncbi:MAG: hypothetical protein SNJ77_02955 [Cytophagales bacterium]
MADNNSSDIILYSSPEGNIKVEVIYSGETFWLTQKRMAELFGWFLFDRKTALRHKTLICNWFFIALMVSYGFTLIQLFPFWKQLEQSGSFIQIENC